MIWYTMDTMPARGDRVLLWRGLMDDDGGFPSIARAVPYMGETVIRYKPEGEDWQELTRDEYPGTMWARIPKPGDEDDAVPIRALAMWLASFYPAHGSVGRRTPREVMLDREGNANLWEGVLRRVDWSRRDLRYGWTEEHHKRDCRDCVEWDTCPVGKGAHERGASIGYSAGECPDFKFLKAEAEK